MKNKGFIESMNFLFFITKNTKMKKIIFLLLLLALATNVTAQKKHHRKHKSSRSSVLRGSRKSQKVQNVEANKENLTRIKNDAALKRMKAGGYLVKITKKVKIDKRLNKKFRYTRPWTNKFLEDMANAFSKRFGNDKLKVNSAVRTVEYQKKLRHRNANAAKSTGDKASSHPTGATVDIAKKNLTPSELTWVRNYLSTFEVKKEIEVTEEKNQAVFHFMVFKRYHQKKITKHTKSLATAQ